MPDAPALWLAQLLLCAPYLQGGVSKLLDFPAAVREMQGHGLRPPTAVAMAVIALELIAPSLVLSGLWRWLGALALAVFTLLASAVALPFWRLPRGAERLHATNAFFEHLGLVGGLLLVVWWDLFPSTP